MIGHDWIQNSPLPKLTPLISWWVGCIWHFIYSQLYNFRHRKFHECIFHECSATTRRVYNKINVIYLCRNRITFAEHGCHGAGSNTSRRVGWEKKLSYQELQHLTNISFIDNEGWLARQPTYIWVFHLLIVANWLF